MLSQKLGRLVILSLFVLLGSGPHNITNTAPLLREAIVLRELQSCSYAEIAAVTEVPVGTVMSRLSRARVRLADLLHDIVDFGDVA